MRPLTTVSLFCLLILLGAADSKTHSVTMKDLQYSPASLKIKAGDTVVWTNSDTHDHTVVASDNSFKSGNIRNGDTFSHQFAKPGNYSYSCSYHPRMKGTIIVE
jgi:plastocyanin